MSMVKASVAVKDHPKTRHRHPLVTRLAAGTEVMSRRGDAEPVEGPHNRNIDIIRTAR
jgi:hypothetical protein